MSMCGKSAGPRPASTTSLDIRLAAEVEQVVHTRSRLVASGRAGTRLVFGTTDAGRYLVVVLADAEDGRQVVVTAREITESERRAFRRRAR